MTDPDLDPFMETFQAVQRIFPLRGEDRELRHVGASYFKAMRRFPLSAVRAGAEVWIQQGKRFPKPAEWIESIPPRTAVSSIQALSESDMHDYLRAEQLRYEDVPCACAACRAAGVSDKPLRFVPEVEADGRDKKALIGSRVIITGHWAHGEELARWYVAKHAFWARMYEQFGCDTPTQKKRVKVSFEQRLKEIFKEPPRTDAPIPTQPSPVVPRSQEADGPPASVDAVAGTVG